MKLIAIKNLSVKYENQQALTNVNIDIFSDDFIGIIGPNGGGKTTLVKSIMGLIAYDGDVTFAENLSISNGTVGYLPQLNNFDRSFPISVTDVISSGLQSRRNITGRIKKAEKLRLEELMDMTGITHLAKKPIGEISGGEIQRTLLCRAMISEPKLLILDEPANFVDNNFEKELYNILSEVNKRMAIIMVSHDLGTITSHVKSIVCVNRTVHRHDSSEITPELLANYNCPIQIITHGDVPHTVLKKH